MVYRGRKFLITSFFIVAILLQLIAITKLKAEKVSYLDSLENALAKASTTTDSIKILCNLAWNYSSSDPQKTFDCGTKALALVSDKEEKQLISEAYDAAALGYWVNKNSESAKKLYRISLRIGEQNKLPDRVAWCNYNLAQLARNENKQDSALMLVKKSQLAFEEADMDDMMINCFWFMMKMLRGEQLNSQCREMISKIETMIESTDNLNTLTFRYLDLSKIYNILENRTKSLDYVLQALETAEKSNNEKGIVTAYSMIGDYLRDVQHNHTVAIQYYERMLETYRKYNSTWGIAETLDEMGLAYMALHNDSMATKYLSESLELAGKLDYRYIIRQANKHMGQIEYRKKDYRKALELFIKSYETRCDGCSPIYQNETMILLGDVYLKLNDYNAAYTFYQKSYNLADSLDDSMHKAMSLAGLANWYKSSGQISSATYSYLQALENAVKTKNLSLQVEMSDGLTAIYSEQNDYHNAFKYQQLSEMLEDSLRNINDNENLARVETLFEFENLRRQKEVESTKAEAEIEKQVLTRNLFLAGFIIMSVLGAFLFVSFRKKKKANILLADQKKRIEEMSAKIHKADKMKLQFFTNISHEFRTPLTLIAGLTEELSTREPKGNIWNNQLKIIQKNASKLLHLVNQILDIRKLDNGDGVIELVQDDLVKFIGGIVTLFEDYAKRKNVGLKFVSEKSVMMIDADYGKLDKIMSNLISNAIKFCSENDHVRVTLYTEQSPNSVFVLEVDDSGRGIPSDQIQYVFQPFYQVTDSEGGSGIGLALVRELVTVLKGQIDIESQLDKGTRVTVKIPYSNNRHDSKDNAQVVKTKPDSEEQNQIRRYTTEEKSEELKENSVIAEQDNGYEKTLLIVEDNPDLLDFVAGILADEYKILKATDGKKGVTIATKYIPDIIVSDIMMPVMDGIQMCELIKNNPCTSHIPILFLTAKTDQESMLHSFKIGADDYIVKPFSAVLLKSRIQNLVNQRRKLIEKFSQQFQVEPTEVILPDADKHFLEKTIRVIEKYIDDPELDIDMLASEMNVSRTQLYRKLKALTDFSGNQFIRVIRLKRAAQLLSQNQLTISEVMQKTGFSNYSYFNQCFREQFNSYPKDYSQLSQPVK